MRRLKKSALSESRGWIFLCVCFCCWWTYVGQSFLAHNQLNDSDSSYFVYGGRLLLKGGGLYRDFWDQKPPGIFYQNAMFTALFGDNFRIWALVHGLAVLASCAGIFLVLRGLLWGGFALLASVLFCYGFNLNNYLDYGNRPEFALSLLEMWAILLGLRFVWRGGGRNLFFSGALSALAFWFKPVGMASFLALGTFLVLAPRTRRGRDLGLLLGGFFSVLVCISAFFAARGLLGEIIKASLLVPLSLGAEGAQSYAGAATEALKAYGPLWGLFIPLPFVLCFLKLSPPQERRQMGYLCLVFLASLAGVLIQKKGHPHYYLQGVGPLVLLSVGGLRLVSEKLSGRVPARIFVHLFLLGFLLLTRWSAWRQWRYHEALDAGFQDRLPYAELADWLKARLEPGEKIYYWSQGFQPYLLTGTSSPGRLSPLFLVHGDGGAELVLRDLGRVAAAPVRFLIEQEGEEEHPLFFARYGSPSLMQQRVLERYRDYRRSAFARLEPPPVSGFAVYQRRKPGQSLSP
ncbi:MAG: glycosyltransferase family 39 protein [Planctomycetes bacterium]|nr:glycosyltransferase family 39 protein [Planctomycetota bacterium]